jgi:hypothetical protein
MQTDKLNRLRAWAGGCGVSFRIDSNARSAHSRATLGAAVNGDTVAAPTSDKSKARHNRPAKAGRAGREQRRATKFPCMMP